MNDYWNDPPDDCEPPECCGELMDVNETTGVCTCSICKKVIEPDCPDYDIKPIEDIECDLPEYEGPAECPHGKIWGECDTCDHESDIAFDAARERRFSR